jgi:hypothetical protein
MCRGVGGPNNTTYAGDAGCGVWRVLLRRMRGRTQAAGRGRLVCIHGCRRRGIIRVQLLEVCRWWMGRMQRHRSVCAERRLGWARAGRGAGTPASRAAGSWCEGRQAGGIVNTKKGVVSGLLRQFVANTKVEVQPRSGSGRQSGPDWGTARNTEFQPPTALDGCDYSRRVVDGKAAAAAGRTAAIDREGEGEGEGEGEKTKSERGRRVEMAPGGSRLRYGRAVWDMGGHGRPWAAKAWVTWSRKSVQLLMRRVGERPPSRHIRLVLSNPPSTAHIRLRLCPLDCLSRYCSWLRAAAAAAAVVLAFSLLPHVAPYRIPLLPVPARSYYSCRALAH